MTEMVTIPKKEYEELKATVETLQDEEVMEQLKDSWKSSSKSLEKFREELEDQ